MPRHQRPACWRRRRSRDVRARPPAETASPDAFPHSNPALLRAEGLCMFGLLVRTKSDVQPEATREAGCAAADHGPPSDDVRQADTAGSSSTDRQLHRAQT